MRRSLDDAKSTPAAALSPRHIRDTLDDPSHRSFPPETADTAVSRAGRLIRLSLDGAYAYGHVGHEPAPARYVRTSLD